MCTGANELHRKLKDNLCKATASMVLLRLPLKMCRLENGTKRDKCQIHEFSPAELCDVLDDKITVEIFAIELANIDVII